MAAEQSKYQLPLNLALGLICLVFAGLIVAGLLTQAEEVNIEAPSFAQNREQPQWRWFTAGSSSTIAVASQEENFSDSYEELNLQGELVGVVIAEDYAAATIQTGREEKVFYMGDEIEPGVEIIGIESKRILVRRNGQTLQLSLPESGLNIRVENQAQPRQFEPLSGQGVITLPNVVLAQPVQTSTHNGGLLMSDINPDLASMVDIRQDDVIVEIGGNDVQSLQSNPVLFLNLANETSLPVTLIRDGEEKVIYINARSLSNRWMPGMRQE